MAVAYTYFEQDNDPTLPVGTTRGWKIGWGYDYKGTVVSVYVAADPGVTTEVAEIPTLSDGEVDVDAVAAFLATFGVSLSDALKQVFGA